MVTKPRPTHSARCCSSFSLPRASWIRLLCFLLNGLKLYKVLSEFFSVLSFAQSFSLRHLAKLHIWSNWNLRSFPCFLTLGSCLQCSVPQCPLPRPMVNVLIQVSYDIILLLRSLKWRHSCFPTISCKRLGGGTFSSFALSKAADAPGFLRLWQTNFLQVPECELPFHLPQTSHMLVTFQNASAPFIYQQNLHFLPSLLRWKLGRVGLCDSPSSPSNMFLSRCSHRLCLYCSCCILSCLLFHHLY